MIHGSGRVAAVAVWSAVLVAWGWRLAAAQKAPRPGPAPVVTAVTVGVDVGDYRGPCPARLTFTATIRAASVPKTPIVYQWIRSDGTKGPRRTTRMTDTTATVTDKWSVGRSGEQMRVWKKLQVLAPSRITSNQAAAAVLCN